MSVSDTRATAADSAGATDDGAAPPADAADTSSPVPVGKRVRGVFVTGVTRLLVVVSLIGLAAGGGILVARVATPPESPTTSTIPGLDIKAAQVAPGSRAPAEPDPAGGKSPTGDGETNDSDAVGDNKDGAEGDTTAESSRPRTLSEWAERAEPVVGVPSRALYAYGHAALAMRAEQPECGVSWATLAAIGRIESNHGRYGGSVLQDNGYPSDPIIGIPLDGSAGVDAISDTDGGALDGDSEHDRAVGPMQFIPSTWQRYASDANGDGSGSPHQIDDAALAAARYLCAGERDMSSAEGWWQGIQSYNNSIEYAKKVFGTSESYAERAQKLTES